MPSDEEHRTARAIVLQRTKYKPAVVSHGEPQQHLDRCSTVMGPPRRPLPRPPNATFRRFSRKASYGCKSSHVNTPCLQKNYSSFLSAWKSELRHDYFPTINSPFEDDKCPWTPPPSKWVPTRPPEWSTDSSSPPPESCFPVSSPPLQHRSPQSGYCAWPHLSQEPLHNEGRFCRMLRRAEGHEVPESRAALIKATEDMEADYVLRLQKEVKNQVDITKPPAPKQPPAPLRHVPPDRPTGSNLREKFKNGGVATTRTEAHYLPGVREDREQQERQQQKEARARSEEDQEKGKHDGEQERKQDYVPDWVKAVLRIKQERPGPDKVFNEDFNFGPKTGDAELDKCSPPLSPRASSTSLPDLCLEVRNKSLKRQRHDSSIVEVMRGPHGRSHSTGSLLFVERPQPDPPIPVSIFKGLETADVHPGHLIDPPDMVDTRSDYMHSSISDFDLNDSASHLEAEPLEFDDESPNFGATFHRSSSSTTRLGHRLESLPGRQQQLAADISAAQETVVEEVRTATCGLQRKPRTIRPQSPFLAASSTSYLTKSRTAESTGSKRLSRRDWLRKRSYIPRCESADAFLRFVRERPEVRRKLRERKSERAAGVEVLDPEWVEERNWNDEVPL